MHTHTLNGGETIDGLNMEHLFSLFRDPLAIIAAISLKKAIQAGAIKTMTFRPSVRSRADRIPSHCSCEVPVREERKREKERESSQY